MAIPQEHLYTFYPVLEAEGAVFAPPSSTVSSEQRLANHSYNLFMRFVPTSFINSMWTVAF